MADKVIGCGQDCPGVCEECVYCEACEEHGHDCEAEGYLDLDEAADMAMLD